MSTYVQFDRLGVRIPTILISPWIKAGTVIGEPGPEATKPAENSEYVNMNMLCLELAVTSTLYCCCYFPCIVVH